MQQWKIVSSLPHEDTRTGLRQPPRLPEAPAIHDTIHFKGCGGGRHTVCRNEWLYVVARRVHLGHLGHCVTVCGQQIPWGIARRTWGERSLLGRASSPNGTLQRTPPRSARCAASLRRLPLNANVGWLRSDQIRGIGVDIRLLATGTPHPSSPLFHQTCRRARQMRQSPACACPRRRSPPRSRARDHHRRTASWPSPCNRGAPAANLKDCRASARSYASPAFEGCELNTMK